MLRQNEYKKREHWEKKKVPQYEIISTDYINDAEEKCTTEANDNIIEILRYDKKIIVYHFGLISLSPTHFYSYGSM